MGINMKGVFIYNNLPSEIARTFLAMDVNESTKQCYPILLHLIVNNLLKLLGLLFVTFE